MLYVTIIAVVQYFDAAIRLRDFMRRNVRKCCRHCQPTKSNICVPDQAPNEESGQNNGHHYCRIIAVQDPAGFMLLMRLEMTLKAKIRVKIAIFAENLGVGGKKMASGEADIAVSATNYISLDSLDPSHCVDIKSIHIE